MVPLLARAKALLRMAQLDLDGPEPSRFLGRLLAAGGIVVSVGALLGLLASALGWVSPYNFVQLWGVLCVAGMVCAPVLFRMLRPLFWLPR